MGYRVSYLKLACGCEHEGPGGDSEWSRAIDEAMENLGVLTLTSYCLAHDRIVHVVEARWEEVAA